ncbi:MAG: gliding motility-associated C-terminal domain-containing protein [Sphingobacteriales bacterium]|nr:gliding motility-associated C-terminal domain-containing protein [Sphingobacteriales bacterium]
MGRMDGRQWRGGERFVHGGGSGELQFTYTFDRRGLQRCGAIEPDGDAMQQYSTEIPELYIPTAFSPNGDGVNDVWQLSDKKDIAKIHVSVFNRWGNEVYESDEIDFQWDGFYKDTEQEMEVYTFYIEVTFDDGSDKFYKGNLTLVR